MTFKEVYLWYCKEKGVFPNVVSLFYAKSPRKVTKNGFYENYTFDEFLESKLYSCGLHNFFSYMFMFDYGASYYKKFAETEKYCDAAKCWNYFVTHNVKLDNDIKKNDKVTFRLPWSNTVEEGVVCNVDLDRFVITVSSHDYSIRILLTDIITHNDKPFELSFHIERKRKKYGVKKG
jgi:hypothetical protein